MRTKIAVFVGLLLTLGTTAFGQNLPALPVIPDISCTSTSTTLSNQTINVPAGGNFQTAIDNANPGDTIVLQAGATYTGNFAFRPKQGEGCITIRSSASDSVLPQTGQRTGPSYASQMAKIVSPNGLYALGFFPGSHHYRFMHLEVAASQFTLDLVLIGGTGMLTTGQAETDVNLLPHHIEFDRVYIHGHPTLGTKRAIALNGRALTVKNSYISDIKAIGADSQAICTWSGGNHYRIVNNYLEAAGENFMAGGAAPWIYNEVPSDIEIRGNYFYKQLSWKKGHPTYAGSEWTIKNLLELKNAKRTFIYGNVLENSWTHAQAGFAVLFTPLNDQSYAPWSTVEDTTFSNNVIRGTERAFQILASGYSIWNTKLQYRILIENNLFLDGPSNRLFQIIGGPRDLTIRHNTMFVTQGDLMYIGEEGSATGLIMENNIFGFGINGILGYNRSPGISPLQYYVGYRFEKNVIIGAPTSVLPQYPTNNMYVGSVAGVSFTNVGAGDYNLSASSPYNNTGTDGKDPGVDWAVLSAARYTKPLTVASTPPAPAPAPAPAPTPTPTQNTTPAPAPAPAPTPTQTTTSPAPAPSPTSTSTSTSNTAPAASSTAGGSSPTTSGSGASAGVSTTSATTGTGASSPAPTPTTSTPTMTTSLVNSTPAPPAPTSSTSTTSQSVQRSMPPGQTKKQGFVDRFVGKLKGFMEMVK
jgi:hypothetical protein